MTPVTDGKVDLKRLFAFRYQCQDHSAHGNQVRQFTSQAQKQGKGEEYVIALEVESEESANVPV